MRFSLRLRLLEAEARVSQSKREMITLKWGVVQQPEFGFLWDNVITSMPENEFAAYRINELLDAMRIPLEPGRLWTSEELCNRLLEHRRYILAVIGTKEYDRIERWFIHKYYRKGKDDAGS